MPKFVVTVKETWSAKVEVEASNDEHALERVYSREVYPSSADFEMESVDDPESWIVEKVEMPKRVPWGQVFSDKKLALGWSDYTNALTEGCPDCAPDSASENTYPAHCDTDKYIGVPCVICDNCGYVVFPDGLD